MVDRPSRGQDHHRLRRNPSPRWVHCTVETVMNSGIAVRLRPATERGRLRPQYDEESGILEVGSSVSREWPFGVDIDGRVVFDLDRNCVLANFDLLIPRRFWRVRDDLSPPPARREADLEFTRQTISQKSFSLPLEVDTDRARSRARIAFERGATDAEAVALSDQCFAFVRDGRLVGFFVTISAA